MGVEPGVRVEAAARAADGTTVPPPPTAPWMSPAECREPLSASCLVNSFNYGSFVVEAVRSALCQTRAFDEVIVVDDGSTDDSRERLRVEFSGEARVTVIEKENEGQLSCFHRGFEASRGDLVCFLDADDVFEPAYLATLHEIYRSHPECHFVSSAYRTFGQKDEVVQRFPADRDLGYSAVLALTRSLVKLWVSPTSTLSMRRTVLERFLPLPRVEDWRTRADDCLLFGSALAGARKYYSGAPLVGYRIHRDNRWYGRTFDSAYEDEREAALDRLLADLQARLGLDDLSVLASDEFARIDRPTLRQWRHYARIAARAPVSPWARLRMLATMARHFAAR